MTLQTWQLAVAAVLPLLAAILTQSHWDTDKKRVIQLGLTIAVSLVGTYLAGQFNIQDIIGTLVIILTGAAIIERQVFSPLGLTPTLSALTDITLPSTTLVVNPH